MPSAQDNHAFWQQHYAWPQHGEEWSEVWGGSAAQWRGTLYPRLAPFLPAARILEIAPGFGRWTHYLQAHCQALVGVDLAERCVQTCQTRFAHLPHLSFLANDGRSLALLPARQRYDLIFSFDSLVHVDLGVLRDYLAQLADLLTPDGVIFLHHSNLGAYAPDFPPPEAQHWRDPTVSADAVQALCAAHGLHCMAQEIVNWGGDWLLDCLTVATLPGGRWAKPYRRFTNPCFMNEALRIGHFAHP